MRYSKFTKNIIILKADWMDMSLFHFTHYDGVTCCYFSKYDSNDYIMIQRGARCKYSVYVIFQI